MRKHVEVAFATCEGNRPKIRVFQIMKMEGTDLYFATSPVKEVYKQLQGNPNIEILSREGQVSVRCVGKAVFEVDEETKKWIYGHNAVLSRLYSSYDKMAYFKMAIEQIQKFYPDYKVNLVPDCLNIIKDGGALNCVSWNILADVEEWPKEEA